MRSNLISAYARLVRLDKPIGILLLLWPALWALWLAAGGRPPAKILAIFIAGVVVMRSAGCIMNDIADRKVDALVARTRMRPLASGEISVKGALVLLYLLGVSALILVCGLLNRLSFYYACLGLVLAAVYPYLKRITHLPQLGLGFAFSISIPMAFAAVQAKVPPAAWVLFGAGVIWPLIYDTMYAMLDREDDLKAGVKSTAILWGRHESRVIAFLQLVFIGLMFYVGVLFKLKPLYNLSLLITMLLFTYQQALIKSQDPQKCFRAFLNNQWVGLIIFLGIGMSKWM
jgi:4-hydroxybenzoate polyprenyltransferase